MEDSKRRIIEKIIGAITFFSTFLPLLLLSNNGHTCEYADNCMQIFYHGHLGICVLNAINDLCSGLSVLWFFAIVGGALEVSKDKNASSPFVFIGAMLVMSVFAALIDPSKWAFAISALLPTILFAICVAFDNYER